MNIFICLLFFFYSIKAQIKYWKWQIVSACGIFHWPLVVKLNLVKLYECCKSLQIILNILPFWVSVRLFDGICLMLKAFYGTNVTLIIVTCVTWMLSPFTSTFMWGCVQISWSNQGGKDFLQKKRYKKNFY